MAAEGPISIDLTDRDSEALLRVLSVGQHIIETMLEDGDYPDARSRRQARSDLERVSRIRRVIGSQR